MWKEKLLMEDNNMAGIILYGAGKKGVKVESMLYQYGIHIKGFCDSSRGVLYVAAEGENIP